MSEAPHLIGETAAILNEFWPKNSHEWTHTLINRTNYAQLPQTWAICQPNPPQVIGSLSLLAWAQLPAQYSDFFNALSIEGSSDEYIWLDSLLVVPEFRGHKVHEQALQTAVSEFLEASESVFKYLILHTTQYDHTFKNMGFESVPSKDCSPNRNSLKIPGHTMIKPLI